MAEAIFVTSSANVSSSGTMTYYSSSTYRVQQWAPNVPLWQSTSSQKIVAHGIFDGPLALPGAQVASWAGTNTTFASVTYGTSDTSSSSRSVEIDVSVAANSSYRMTKGFGPAWDIALAAGNPHVTGSSTETISEQDIEQTAL